MRDTAYIVQYRTREHPIGSDPVIHIRDRIEIGPNEITITGPDAAALLRRICDLLNREKP